MLKTVALSLDPMRIAELEGKLARETALTRPAEWELVIAYALSQIGTIRDFEKSPTGRSPDFIWTLNNNPIIVEVTAISDDSLHEINSIEYFLEELRRILKKNHLLMSGGINYEFGAVELNNKIVLGIPAKADISKFFSSQDFKDFITSIKKSPDEKHVFRFTERGSESWIEYSRGKAVWCGSFRSYTSPQNYRNTRVFKSLKSKEEQIRNSNSDLPAILVICDNGCDALRATRSATYDQVGIRAIVGLFLNGQKKKSSGGFTWQEGVPAQGSRIHSVIWITVNQPSSHFSINRNHQLNWGIEFASYASPNISSQNFIDALTIAFNTLPPPLHTPRNANIEKRKYPQFFGRYQMSQNKVQFSALTLQKLLTGEISQSEFEAEHTELVALLKNIRNAGLTLSHAQVEINQNDDDDWIKLEFKNMLF